MGLESLLPLFLCDFLNCKYIIYVSLNKLYVILNNGYI